MTGKVRLPASMIAPGVPGWAVNGRATHRQNVITSIFLTETDLEMENEKLLEKYNQIARHEQRADLFCCDDAEIVVVAANTPSRLAKGAVSALRARGVKAGLFRPVTLWPFPILALEGLLDRARRLIVVEASPGQLEDEMRLAMSRAGVRWTAPIENVQRYGGVLPSHDEIVARVLETPSVKSQGATV
jgi:pyruvate/2-oxoacid:ferredoxin oxidoreductase alpha subunit